MKMLSPKILKNILCNPNANGGCSKKSGCNVSVNCKNQKLPWPSAKFFETIAYRSPSINIPSENMKGEMIVINIPIINM